MYETTFDLSNQPGFPKAPITRQMVINAIEALGIDPSATTQVHIGPDDGVTVTMLLKDKNGARALGAPGDTFGVHDSGGFLKHTYTAKINDENGDSK